MPSWVFNLFAVPAAEWALRQLALWFHNYLVAEEKKSEIKGLHDKLETAATPEGKADAAKNVLSWMRANWKS